MNEIGAVDESTWFFRNVVKKRVTWGFICAAVFLVFACPTRESVFWGFWIALAGEVLRTWASGVIVKNEALSTGGPYGFTRNPLYVGSFLIGVGVAAMGGNLWLLVLFLVLFLPAYYSLARKEEQRLLDRYGDDFLQYCREVPRFLPNFKTWRPSSREFDLRRMWKKHREWQAWLGLYAVTLYLLLRAR